MLSFELNSHVLDKLHAALLSKLGVMKTFPTVMRGIPTYFGGLNLHLAEVEALVQATHDFISLYEAETLTRSLLQILIEYHQLEIGSNRQLFSLSYGTFGHLATNTWITSLWQHTSHYHLQIALPPLNLQIA